MPVNDAPINQMMAPMVREMTPVWTLWFVSIAGALKLAGRSYTVANLPAANSFPAGMASYASNGRKGGEGAGAGTGVPIWTDGTKWLTFYDNTEVQA